jgi:heme-degrading monooxygenase HmoA
LYRTVWKFVVKADRVEEFTRHYASGGTWAQLFHTGDGYLGTELYRDGDAFVTIDSWRDEASYRKFRDEHRETYEALDRETEGLTVSEEHIAETVSTTG